jgi:predicted sulfurtransferase
MASAEVGLGAHTVTGFASTVWNLVQGGDPYMADNLRIAVDDLRKRMEAGEDFVFIDTRNPQTWAQSDVKVPEAIRLPVDRLDENLSKIPKNKPVVAYCT